MDEGGDDDDVQWCVGEDLYTSRDWIGDILKERLPRLDIKDVKFINRYNYWDGPLNGLADWNGSKCYYVALFDEAALLSADVGRCYLLYGVPGDMDLEYIDAMEGIPENDLLKLEPLGWFPGTLAYFMTHPEANTERTDE